MAAVRQIGSKIYAVVRLPGHPMEKKTFTTKEEARVWAEAREAALGGKKSMAGRKRSKGAALDSCDLAAIPISPPPPMTLGDAIRRFQEEVTERPGKPGPHRSRLRYWLNDPLAFKPLDAITAVDLTAWRQKAEVALTRYGRVVSPQTNIHRLNTLSSIYKHARYEWAMPKLENPVKDVRKPTQPPGRAVKFSPEQRKIFWQVVRSEHRSIWVYYITKLAILTAMRQGELLAVVWENWHGRVVHLPKTKNGHPRDVPLSSEALAILQEWHELRGKPQKGRLFPFTSTAIQQAHRRVMASIAKDHPEFPHVTFHDLRHVAATDLSKKLSNVLELAAVTGHRSLQVLKRYYNPDANELALKLG